jgi:formyltetrahydrofolate-dependent phosphoribosylglycinamide formyltransferase
MKRKRVVILISGRGTNMGALAAAAAERDFPAEIAGVISNQAEASGLQKAAALGLKTRVVLQGEHGSREQHDEALQTALGEFDAEIVCLAGYMRLLTPAFVDAWEGRMINIHPSLLPAFRGLDTHARALQAGVRIHGCSVHFVTHEVDAGPIIAQAAVPVLPGDTAEALAARVLSAEHKLYPLALALIASGKARMESGRVVLEGVEEPHGTLLSPASWHGARDLEDLARFTP